MCSWCPLYHIEDYHAVYTRCINGMIIFKVRDKQIQEHQQFARMGRKKTLEPLHNSTVYKNSHIQILSPQILEYRKGIGNFRSQTE